jgi:histidyl-tRNA synthetase
LARELRHVAATEVDLSGRSLKATLRGADRSGARVAVLLGDDELERGVATVRDLAAGSQSIHEWAAVAAECSRILAGPEGAA